MPTVFNRCYAYAKDHKIPILSQKERTAAGRQIAEAYHQSGIKKPIRKQTSVEDEGTFTVLYYPPEFSKPMDAIISIAYQNRENVLRGTSEPARKRKRIPLRKKEYSASPLNHQINA